jgi:hypothetical protein
MPVFHVQVHNKHKTHVQIKITLDRFIFTYQKVSILNVIINKVTD